MEGNTSISRENVEKKKGRLVGRRREKEGEREGQTNLKKLTFRSCSSFYCWISKLDHLYSFLPSARPTLADSRVGPRRRRLGLLTPSFILRPADTPSRPAFRTWQRPHSSRRVYILRFSRRLHNLVATRRRVSQGIVEVPRGRVGIRRRVGRDGLGSRTVGVVVGGGDSGSGGVVGSGRERRSSGKRRRRSGEEGVSSRGRENVAGGGRRGFGKESSSRRVKTGFEEAVEVEKEGVKSSQSFWIHEPRP